MPDVDESNGGAGVDAEDADAGEGGDDASEEGKEVSEGGDGDGDGGVAVCQAHPTEEGNGCYRYMWSVKVCVHFGAVTGSV